MRRHRPSGSGGPGPTDIAVHDFLTVGGAKLSKSLGTVVDPIGLAAEYGVDALRWWLVSQVTSLGETDFTVEGLVEVANRDLAGGFGNLTERVAAMLDRFRGGRLRAQGPGLIPELPARIDAALDRFDFRAAAQALREAVAETNRYVEETRPWELARAESGGDRAAAERLDLVLGGLVATVTELARELAPVLPGLAARMTARLSGQGGEVIFRRRRLG